MLSFYREFLQKPKWIYDGEWAGTTQRSISGHQAVPEPLAEDIQFYVLMDKSEEVSELWYSPPEAIRRAVNAGQTVYIVKVSYFQDITIQHCPPVDWWRVETPYYD